MKKVIFLISMVVSGMLFHNCTNKNTSKQMVVSNRSSNSSLQVDGSAIMT